VPAAVAEAPGSIDAEPVDVPFAKGVFPVELGTGVDIARVEPYRRVRVQNVGTEADRERLL
jgi:hypothetical protein